MVKIGLGRAIYTIYVCRVAADHYVLNPTRVMLTSRPWKGMEEKVTINANVVKRIIHLAYQILSYLEGLG